MTAARPAASGPGAGRGERRQQHDQRDRGDVLVLAERISTSTQSTSRSANAARLTVRRWRSATWKRRAARAVERHGAGTTASARPGTRPRRRHDGGRSSEVGSEFNTLTQRRISPTTRGRRRGGRERLGQAGHEAVADAGLGDDLAGRAGIEPPAQLGDEDADVRALGRIGLAPHLGRDHPVREHAVRVPREADQQVELGRRQRQRPLADGASRRSRSMRIVPRSMTVASSGAARSPWRSAVRTRASSSGTENGLET